MNLKQTFKKDLDTFINDGEFADYWTINGKSVKAVIDNSVVNTLRKLRFRVCLKLLQWFISGRVISILCPL